MTAPTPTAADLRQVEILAASLRERLDRAAILIAEHDAEVGAIRAKYAGPLRRLAAEVAGARKALIAAIRDAAALYLAPKRKAKSDVLHGIVCGIEQGKVLGNAKAGALLQPPDQGAAHDAQQGMLQEQAAPAM
jgi:hypothetical protein